MKVGVLTAALQELTPREVRDADPDRAIEDWIAFARELGRRLHPAVGGAAPDRDRRAARGDARSGREHARPAQAVRQGSRARACRRRSKAHRRRHLRHRLLRQHAAPRSGDPRRRSTTSCCACSTPPSLLGVDAVCGFVGRNQQRSMDENLRRLRGAVRAAAQGREGARPDLPRRAVPDAGLDDRRQLAQQHRLHARARGSRCTASARSTASAISSASTTTRRTRS